MKIKTIVALIDLTEGTKTIVEYAKAAALAFQSKLTLLHVLTNQPVVVDIGIASPTFFLEPTAGQKKEHHDRLAQIRDSLAASGIEVSAEEFQGVPVEELLPECRRLHADLIVMGAHHRNILDQLVFRSVSHRVLHEAVCPALVVPIAKSAEGSTSGTQEDISIPASKNTP